MQNLTIPASINHTLRLANLDDAEKVKELIRKISGARGDHALERRARCRSVPGEGRT